jgi:hypothetical protein
VNAGSSLVECANCHQTFAADAQAGHAQCPHCGSWNQWDPLPAGGVGEPPARPGRHTASVIATALVLLVVGGVIGAAIEHGRRANPSSTTAAVASRTHRAHRRFRPVYLDTRHEASGDQVTPGVVVVNGHTYKHGLQFGVSWISDYVSATYRIPHGATTFSTGIGNDDNQPNPMWSGIRLLYEVFVDGRRAAVGHAKAHHHSPRLHARVRGDKTITLAITNVGDAFGGTEADWVSPLFR